MNCADVQCLLHPYSDGELDLIRHVQMEEHLAGCAECAQQEKNLQSLRTAISSPSLYHAAPAALRAKIQAVARLATREDRWSAAQWLAAAASLLFLVGLSAVIGMWSRGAMPAHNLLAESVVAGHVRSLQADHLTDVASSDRHTVKPWFRGQLDFSPQVPDLSEQGYPLSGGRLDYLADRPVAALVYYRRLHAINVFTWPGGDDKDKAVQQFSRQGFHLCHWQKSGMTYWAISDLNDQEFGDFVRLFQEHSSELRP